MYIQKFRILRSDNSPTAQQPQPTAAATATNKNARWLADWHYCWQWRWGFILTTRTYIVQTTYRIIRQTFWSLTFRMESISWRRKVLESGVWAQRCVCATFVFFFIYFVRFGWCGSVCFRWRVFVRVVLVLNEQTRTGTRDNVTVHCFGSVRVFGVFYNWANSTLLSLTIDIFLGNYLSFVAVTGWLCCYCCGLIDYGRTCLMCSVLLGFVADFNWCAVPWLRNRHTHHTYNVHEAHTLS